MCFFTFVSIITSNKDSIFDRTILMICSSSTPDAVITWRELLIKLLKKCSNTPVQSVPVKTAHRPHS